MKCASPLFPLLKVKTQSELRPRCFHAAGRRRPLVFEWGEERKDGDSGYDDSEWIFHRLVGKKGLEEWGFGAVAWLG